MKAAGNKKTSRKNSIVIRHAVKNDLDQIIELCDQHAAYEGAPYSKTGKKERLGLYLFTERPPLMCLVVEQDERIKGYATYMREFSTWDASYYMHMDCLFLKEEMRGQGIGKKLVAMITEAAEESDCVNVQWQTPTDNTNAIMFYDKLGAFSRHKLRFFLR